MVSAVGALLALQLGLLAVILLPLLGQLVALDIRQRIVSPYYKWAETVLGPCAIVWRRLGRPTIKPIEIDDEREVAEVTQTSGTLSDDQKLPFRDPADAKRPLFSKQLTVVPEGVPAAIDAEMAELSHWFNQQASRGHLETGDGRIDPHLPVPEAARTVNPLDVLNVLDEDVTSEDIKTTERHTEARFQKYGGGPSAKEAGAMFVSFAVGAGIVMGAVYLRQEVLGDGGGSAGGSTTVPIPMVDVTSAAADIMVMLL